MKWILGTIFIVLLLLSSVQPYHKQRLPTPTVANSVSPLLAVEEIKEIIITQIPIVEPIETGELVLYPSLIDASIIKGVPLDTLLEIVAPQLPKSLDKLPFPDTLVIKKGSTPQ